MVGKACDSIQGVLECSVLRTALLGTVQSTSGVAAAACAKCAREIIGTPGGCRRLLVCRKRLADKKVLPTSQVACFSLERETPHSAESLWLPFRPLRVYSVSVHLGRGLPPPPPPTSAGRLFVSYSLALTPLRPRMRAHRPISYLTKKLSLEAGIGGGSREGRDAREEEGDEEEEVIEVRG